MHLQHFNYNGSVIQRRDDGFVSLTQMCQANGKRLKDFLESKRALQVIHAYYAIQSGQIRHPIEYINGETWGCFSLASELAYQSDARFHVWFDTILSPFENLNKLFVGQGYESFLDWKKQHFPWTNDISNEKPKQGTVYFALNETRKLLKIGFTSAKEPDVRLNAFRSGTPKEKIVLLGFVAGTLKTEAMYHCYLKDCQYSGEWFNYTQKVQAFVEEILNHDN